MPTQQPTGGRTSRPTQVASTSSTPVKPVSRDRAGGLPATLPTTGSAGPAQGEDDEHRRRFDGQPERGRACGSDAGRGAGSLRAAAAPYAGAERPGGRRILVPLDGSRRAAAALPYAVTLASATAAPTSLLAVVDPSPCTPACRAPPGWPPPAPSSGRPAHGAGAGTGDDRRPTATPPVPTRGQSGDSGCAIAGGIRALPRPVGRRAPRRRR